MQAMVKKRKKQVKKPAAKRKAKFAEQEALPIVPTSSFFHRSQKVDLIILVAIIAVIALVIMFLRFPR